MYENFDKIASVIQKEIDGGFIAGAQAAVIHKNDTVYRRNFGMADKQRQIPMENDTIFRLFSMTKPVTACAAMILLERGQIDLCDPLKWYLPTFENPTVVDQNGERPADRDITLSDLLSMTSGITYPDATPSGEAMGALWGEQSENYIKGKTLLNTRDFALEMGKKPLAFSPGERWMYGASADVMGAVIEAVSGITLGEFFEREIFSPLGMTNTGFYVPESCRSKLAEAYEYGEQGLQPFKHFHLCLTDYSQPPAFESGGAGLVSTIDDYAKFAKMLLNKGEFNGTHILGRKTVEFMTKNFLNDRQLKSLDWDSMVGQGYGCFMRTLLNAPAAGLNCTQGQYGWDGWMGCFFTADPTEELAMLYFIQLAGAGTTRTTRLLQNIVWGAID